MSTTRVASALGLVARHPVPTSHLTPLPLYCHHPPQLTQLDDAKGGMRTFDTDSSIYLASLHFSIMTLTTVGYGDISPLTNLEFITVGYPHGP